MDLGNKIKANNAMWSFDKKVPKTFSQHIKNSVPFYDEGHNICIQLSDFFLKEKSNCYDFGCSTGTLINKISNRADKKINFYGIDIVKEMIIQAKKENKKTKTSNKINYINNDFLKTKIKKSNFILSYYTIQFMPPRYRQTLINKIYKSLNWGGGFIMFEKIRASDARFQDLMNQIYLEYKHDIGYNEKQVWNKSLSLRGVLEPYSTNENVNFLKRAGFKDYMSILKYSCFEGFLAIK